MLSQDLISVYRLPDNTVVSCFNLLPTECRLLITFANSLNPDQAQQNVGPWGSNLFDTQMVLLKEFFEKADFEKNQQTTKKTWKISQGAKKAKIFLLVDLWEKKFRYRVGGLKKEKKLWKWPVDWSFSVHFQSVFFFFFFFFFLSVFFYL